MTKISGCWKKCSGHLVQEVPCLLLLQLIISWSAHKTPKRLSTQLVGALQIFFQLSCRLLVIVVACSKVMLLALKASDSIKQPADASVKNQRLDAHLVQLGTNKHVHARLAISSFTPSVA